jgi:hypothetical protein
MLLVCSAVVQGASMQSILQDSYCAGCSSCTALSQVLIVLGLSQLHHMRGLWKRCAGAEQ